MTNGGLPADVKRCSALRRVPHLNRTSLRAVRGVEGDVCAFELSGEAHPITVESPSGRLMAIAPGEVFLATPGCRESTRWVSGRIPDGGLVPEHEYWVLADCGIVGEPVGEPPCEQGHFGRVRYLGVVCRDPEKVTSIREFAVTSCGRSDRGTPVYLVLGTSGNSGKTT